MSTLSATQQRGLLRLGDALIPGDGDMPSFSESGCAEYADRILVSMYSDDRAGLKGVLTLCAILPRPLIRKLFAMTDRHENAPEPVAGLLRMANVGIKGFLMTLYYSDIGGGHVFSKMGWDPVVHRQPQEPTDGAR